MYGSMNSDVTQLASAETLIGFSTFLDLVSHCAVECTILEESFGSLGMPQLDSIVPQFAEAHQMIQDKDKLMKKSVFVIFVNKQSLNLTPVKNS